MARALGGLPKIDEAFGAGRLSYAQVRAVTRVATPDNEARVLEIALAATGAQLERICRHLRNASVSATDAEAAADRRLRARVLPGGLVKLSVIVTADEADLVFKALERAREQLRERAPSQPDVSAETPAPAVGPSAADALMHLATSYLGSDGDAGEASAPDRYQVVVHLEPDLLAQEDAAPAMAARLDDGTHVSAETLRRIACDSGLVPAVVGEAGEVLDIGRRTRAIPTAIRRALWLRDRGCRFPGCANTRFLHGHHMKHWLHGGPTSLDNLVMLCPFHHRQIHEGGFEIRLDASGAVEVITPKGLRVPAVPAPPPAIGADDLVVWLNDWDKSDGRDIDAWTATSSWDGEAPDYDEIVGAGVVSDELPKRTHTST